MELKGPLLSWQFELWIRLLAEKKGTALSLLFQVWALIEEIKKRNPSPSSFQPFIQQPASILSVLLLGGGLRPRSMWVLLGSRPVNHVLKSALP